jgi:hypothetical protein
MTVVRWRYRVLRELRARRVCWCAGKVELVRLTYMDPPWSSVVTAVDDGGRAMELWLPPNAPRPRLADTLRRHIGAGSRVITADLTGAGLLRAAMSAGLEAERACGGHPPRARARARSIRRWVTRFGQGGRRDPLGYVAWYAWLNGEIAEALPIPTPRWFRSAVGGRSEAGVHPELVEHAGKGVDGEVDVVGRRGAAE